MVESPFPKGTKESVIYVGADGKVLPDKEGAVRGEVTVTYPPTKANPNGRVEHTTFSLNGQPPQY